MSLSEIELKRIKKAIDAFMALRRPHPTIRSQLDFGYRIVGHSVELFEIRPQWNDESKILHRPFAKMMYVRSKNHWKLFWQRADLKWHSYPPAPLAKSIEEALKIVSEDDHCCFFG